MRPGSPGSLLFFGGLVLLYNLFQQHSINGQINPMFTCTPQVGGEPLPWSVYDVSLVHSPEILVSNCTATTINAVLLQLHESKLKSRPVKLSLHSSITVHHLELTNFTRLDLGHNDLVQIDLRSQTQLKVLNLTSNSIRDLRKIEIASNHTLEILDVSRNRLLELTGYIPAASRLFLRSNTIFNLSSNFTFPTTLLELDLTRNEIENLTLVQFFSSSLQVLNLSINLINSISNSTFSGLIALQVLVLECNKIHHVPAAAFSSNTQLMELNLRDNNLSVLKKEIFEKLTNLQTLDVSRNRLLSLEPDTVQHLNNLVHFSLSENLKLCNTSECNKDLQFLLVLGGRLKVLKLNRLTLKRFPVTLTTSIRQLDLSVNNLTSVQVGDLENFPFLQTLILSWNQIRVADKDVFSRLECLEHLLLDHNRLVGIPSSLPVTLRTLNLDANRISKISNADLRSLGSLTELKLRSNSIFEIDSDSFASLNALRVLDISNNPLRVLNTDALEGANKLENLQASYLTRVKINSTDLRYFPVSDLPNLRLLNLSHSPQLVRAFLNDFPLLNTVKQVDRIDFDSATLTTLPPHLQHFLPRLDEISLRGNELNCSSIDWGEWIEPASLEFQPLQTGFGGLQVVRHSIATPCGRRVLIHSHCLENDPGVTNSSEKIRGNQTQMWKNIIPVSEFWRSVKEVDPTTLAPSFWKPGLTKPKKATLPKSSKLKSQIKPFNSSGLPAEDTWRNLDKLQDSWQNPPLLPTKISSEQPGLARGNGAGKFEALVWNQSSGARPLSSSASSFLDWFPSQNSSNSEYAGRTFINLEDNNLPYLYTHAGLVIFFAATSILLVTFLALLVAPSPSCATFFARKRRRSHQLSRANSLELEEDSRRDVEISSISAFVEMETRVE